MNIIAREKAIRTVELDTRMLNMNSDGLIEVYISEKFTDKVRELLDIIVRQKAHPIAGNGRDEKLQSKVRKSFLEHSIQLIKRLENDLNPEEVCILHFALIKSVISQGQCALDHYIEQRKNRAAELKHYGSAELLSAQEHLAWLHKNSDQVLYRSVGVVLAELKRVENRHLRSAWKKFSMLQLNSAELLFNPALATPNVQCKQFLLEKFYLWEALDKRLPELNQKLEKKLSRHLKELPILRLNDSEEGSAETSTLAPTPGVKKTPSKSCQYYLGKQKKDKFTIKEEYCWIDNPNSIEELFNIEAQQSNVKQIRSSEGLKASVLYTLQSKKLEKQLRKVSDLLDNEYLLNSCIAARKTREIWPAHINRHLNGEVIYQYLNGSLPLTTVEESLPAPFELQPSEINLLKESQKIVTREYRENEEQYSFLFLKDLAKFRRNLKSYRFAHNLFQRIELLDSKEKVQRSRLSGILYEVLPTEKVNETLPTEEEGNPVAHECVLNMSIRGVADLRKEIEKREADSSRFLDDMLFQPLHLLFKGSPANVMTLDETRLTLSLQEYSKTPERWRGVSAICHLAHTFLDKISELNTFNQRANLPEVTCSIGIAYGTDQVLLEHGSEHARSRAIAEFLSTSNLSKLHDSNSKHFNCHIQATNFNEESSTPSNHLKPFYSVRNNNGILLSSGAFNKLKSEMSLQRIHTQIDKHKHLIHVGTWVAEEQRQEVWIREQKLQSDPFSASVVPHDSMPCYFELLRNTELVNNTRKALSRQLQQSA